MSFSSLRSPRPTSITHHDRGFTLVFGSDGQVSLIGFDDGTASQAPYTLSVSDTGALTPGTHALPSDSTSISPVPNLEATSASLTGTFSSMPTTTTTPTSTLTSISSSLASSSYDPSSSSTTTDTDTNLPSVPTVNYPTPAPTSVSDPKDHGVGAPFYLAIVLASISFIGCVSAFIAWWIRSRSRKDDLELDDPWNHRDTLTDTGSPLTDNANASDKGAQTRAETQAQPYYLPASIVRRSSSNLLAVPHTIPTSGGGTSQAVLDAGRYPSLHPAKDARSQNLGAEPNSYQNMSSSQTANLYPYPGMQRLQTGLSVQESTRTLGRLRVANRVPGDVTSGDEGGMNPPRLQNSAGPSSGANTGGVDVASVGENAMRNPHSDESDRPVDVLLEPPGPATYSWGRRENTVAALRRTQRGTPGTTVQTYNAKYGGYLYPNLDAEPHETTWKGPAATTQEENRNAHANPSLDPLGWKDSLKSSFWQAVDAMTGNRPSDSEPRAANTGSGSRFTPAPQRVASRRSPISPIRVATGSTPPDAPAVRPQEVAAKNDLTILDKLAATEGVAPHSTHPSFVGSSTRVDVPSRSEVTLGRVGSLPPRVSHLNLNLNATTHIRHPESLRTDTGSVYSTDSAAARANLRKYGYGDPIPSSWSALAATRESQLNLDHVYLPPPRAISRSSPSPLSITPSQLTLESGLLSSSASTRTRTHTPMHSEIDLIGSDAGTVRSGKNAPTPSHGETTTTSSLYTMSRNGTMQSGRGTIGHETVPSHSSSTTSSMVSRKKGVTSRRKRPRPPPRAPSSASSVQSIESGLSVREVAVRRALLERRKKVKEVEGLKGREDSLARDAG